jgi:hypothetical protein
MDVRIKPFRSSWASQAHLGPFVDWHEIGQVDIGLELGPVVLGLRFLIGNEVVDPYELDRSPRWPLGEAFQNEFGMWHYARAGVTLKRGTIVEPSLAAKILNDGGYPAQPEMGELIYGDVRPIQDPDKATPSALGWPEVDVPERRYFWLHDMKEAAP